MKRILLLTGLSVFLMSGYAHALPLVSIAELEVHNPTGASFPDGTEKNPKSQFYMTNQSDPGITIQSIFWDFSTSDGDVFIDSALGGPGFGSSSGADKGYRDYQVAPADATVPVLANSDVLTGYTGPTSFADGVQSMLLTFNDFDPNETFGLWTDLDSTLNTTGRVGNIDFNGTKTKIVFSDGSIVDFVWDLPANNGRTFLAEDLVGTPPPPPTNVIPEPSTMMLLSSGIVGAFLRKRKKA